MEKTLFAERFIRIFKRKVDRLYSNCLIGGVKEPDTLGYHEHTFLINVAVYMTIKEINKKSHNKYSIVPEHGGRSPTDFMIRKNDKDFKLSIEHENAEHRIIKNYEKLIKKKDTKERLLIGYVGDKTSIEDKIDELKRYKKKHKIVNKHVYVMIAKKGNKEFFYNSHGYRHELI